MEPITFTWISIIGLTLTFGILLINWFVKHNDRKLKEKDDRKKEIKDAVASGDVSRIHRIIDQLRK